MKRASYSKFLAALVVLLISSSCVLAQQIRMNIGGGYSRALAPLADYTEAAFVAGAGMEYEAQNWFAAGVQFQYSGFPLDTSRLDFASTLIPINFYGQFQYPATDVIKPYVGLGGGLLFVRYVFSQGISVRETHAQWAPRAGVKFDLDEALQLDLNFNLYQSFNELAKKGSGPELAIPEYRYWTLSFILAYTISEN